MDPREMLRRHHQAAAQRLIRTAPPHQPTVVREWRGRKCSVFTVHGESRWRRGEVHMTRAGWLIHDLDGYDHDIVGDYLDAEAALFALSPWMDDPDIANDVP